uniref:Uncharacterized protein n=2 Tax=Oreochromis TaxID=8139 RepID=A0A669C0Q4_ORENI
HNSKSFRIRDLTALMVGLLFFSLIPPAEAYDAGDALALLLCTILTVVGFCACLAYITALVCLVLKV